MWVLAKLVFCFAFSILIGGGVAHEASSTIIGSDDDKAFALGFVPTLAITLYLSFFIQEVI